MDNETMIDSQRIRALREQRAWSQEQLAQVSGLSVRTVQRVEASGSASMETRMALAVAFGIGQADLLAEGAAVAPGPVDDAQPSQAQRVSTRLLLVALLIAVVVMLQLQFGYQVGKDMAQRDNRTACGQAGRTDCDAARR